jgi:hypothetical protein
MAKIDGTVGGLNSALETVCGWALCAGAAYALLFVNLTGDGALWGSMVGAVKSGMPGPELNVPTKIYRIPAKPSDEATREQNRMLMFSDNDKALAVAVEDPSARRTAAWTDAPADPSVGALPKDWKVHLQGQMRTFTVYGQGDQAGAATAGSARAAAVAVVAAVASAHPTPAAAGSAFRAAAADEDATPRPGISDRAPAMHEEGSDGLRNFLGGR